MKINKIFFLPLILVLIFFAGCSSSGISMTSQLEENKIISEENTELIVYLENIADKTISGKISVITKNNEVMILNQDDMDIILKSKESITKRIKIKGVTNSLKSDYAIDIQFISENNILAENTVVLTVEDK